MQFPSKSYLEQLRKKYPVGTKLQLISMRNEKYPVLPGTVGEVSGIVDGRTTDKNTVGMMMTRVGGAENEQ